MNIQVNEDYRKRLTKRNGPAQVLSRSNKVAKLAEDEGGR